MAEKQKNSFEKELNDVKEIVQKLSNPELTLSDGVGLYKDGVQKLKIASELLENAKLEIESYETK